MTERRSGAEAEPGLLRETVCCPGFLLEHLERRQFEMGGDLQFYYQDMAGETERLVKEGLLEMTPNDKRGF